MAKENLKSENIIPLGGIFHVRELFSRYVGPVIDEVLGLRYTSFGYQYNEIVETIKNHSELFFIHTNRCSSFYDSLFALRGWKRETINGIEHE